MKNQNIKNEEVLTKGFVREEIQSAIFASEFRMKGYIDDKFEDFKLGNDQKFSKVIEMLVDVLAKFEKSEEENTIVKHRQDQHGERIEKLENKVFSVAS
jgi:hypothetical protein